MRNLGKSTGANAGITANLFVCKGAGSVLIADRDLLRSQVRVTGAISAANGSRFSNSDQIRNAQKWRLSIPPDSSRRDEAPAPNRVKIGRWTHPTRRLKFRRVRSTRAREEGDGHDEDIPEQSLNEEACVETSDRDYSGGTNERVPEATRRGQKKRPEKRSQEGGHRGQEKRYRQMMAEGKIQRNCLPLVQRQREVFSTHVACDFCVISLGMLDSSGYKTPSPSSLACVGARGARGSDAPKLQAARGGASGVRFSRGLVLELRLDVTNLVVCSNAIFENFEFASGGILRVSKGNRKCCKRRKTEGLYQLEGVSRQEELLSDIGPVVLARRMDEESNRCTEACKASAGISEDDVLEGSGVVQEHKEMLWDTCGSLARHEKVQPVQDVHGEAQRRETESMRDGVTTTCKTTYFAAHPGEGEQGHLSEKVQALQFGSAFTSVEMELPVEEE
ncbi:hypothetical protein Acr_25g0003770 [Actinidia rufa]|uniref:Uncharacterized protein n=1 Tax=Actinidia rufa TaxID=165716 RepID=A0A7J0GZ08_9ERIC|nr:hypothetical protein Acr_25g0003770 [Actinidia rufa]